MYTIHETVNRKQHREYEFDNYAEALCMWDDICDRCGFPTKVEFFKDGVFVCEYHPVPVKPIYHVS